MSYLVRREKFADGTPPPKKPYSAVQFKNKADTLLQGVYGTGKSSNAFLVDLMQKELDKAVTEGVVTMQEGLEFIKSRKKYYDDYLKEQSKTTDGPIGLPQIEERTELAIGGGAIKGKHLGTREGFGRPRTYDLDAIEKAIIEANKGLKYISQDELGEKFGLKNRGHLSTIIKRQNLPDLESYATKAEKAFLELFSDPNRKASEVEKPLYKIKQMIGGHKTRVDNNPDRVRIDDISKALKNSKILDYKKEVKPIIDKLSSSNFLKNINSDWTIGDVENSIQSNSMLRSPKTDAERLMDYVVRNQKMSKGNTEFSIYDKKNLNKRITDLSKIDAYQDIVFKDGKGKVYDMDYIKTKGRSDPLFKEYFDLQDKLFDMKNRTTWPDGSDIIDPKTGKKVNFGIYSGQMYKYGYGYKKPFQRFAYDIDHIEGVGKNPFKNLTILPQRINVALGSTTRLNNPSVADKVGQDFFRNLSVDDLLMQEKDLGKKILLFDEKGEHVGKKLKPSYTAAKEEIIRKEDVLNKKKTSKISDLKNIEGVTTADKVEQPEKSKIRNMFDSFNQKIKNAGNAYRSIRPGIDALTTAFPGKADNAIAAAIDFPMMYMSGAPFSQAAASAGSMFMNNPNIGKMANVALEQAALSEEEQFLKNAMERKQGLESMLENIPTRFKETIEKNKGVKDEFEEFVP
jgi:hypothetical protein